MPFTTSNTTITWDDGLVRDCFWKEDADLILSLPVHERMEDMIASHYNNNGLFSLKSAYKVEIIERRRGHGDRGQSSSSSDGVGDDDECWKKMWKIKCPKKMLHFLWRLGHNSLALRMNLRRRGMRLDTVCVQSGRLDEDGVHLLFKCKKVRQIWNAVQLEHIRVSLAAIESAKAVVEEIIKLKEAGQRLVVILLYLWWSERCAVREGKGPRSSSQLGQIIRTYAEECSVFEKIRTGPVHRPTIPASSKPPEGFVKLNCDGAFRDHDLSGGWGFVIRDSEGVVIGVGYGRLQKVLEPLHAELVACLLAVQRTVELGVQKIILATDAAAVIQALCTQGVD